MKTAEFVTPMHPDKICDRISDAILDAYLQKDPNSRVAIETMGGHGQVYITGEVTSKAEVSDTEIRLIVSRVANGDYVSGNTTINIVTQSPEIAQGVDTGGAGDQGIMRGYATRETDTFMPLEYELARDLARFLYGKFPVDGKTQITLDNQEKIIAIVASFQNSKKQELRELIELWASNRDTSDKLKIYTNPAGDWSIGGFDADTGLTGRKLAVDNYGPQFPIGGGAFSGKDPSKVDRSGAYIARRLALETLKRYNDAQEAFVEIAYAIGMARPVEIDIKVKVDDGQLIPIIDVDDLYERLTPQRINEEIDLKQPIYEKTAEWGHFADLSFKWNQI